MSKKLIFAFLALSILVGSAFASPAKADWDHHHYRGYWHNGVWINLGPDPYYYPPAYTPYYAPVPAPAYYYPPAAPAYYYPPPAYGYAPPYFMGVPVGIGLNFRIH